MGASLVVVVIAGFVAVTGGADEAEKIGQVRFPADTERPELREAKAFR